MKNPRKHYEGTFGMNVCLEDLSWMDSHIKTQKDHVNIMLIKLMHNQGIIFKELRELKQKYEKSFKERQ